MTRKIKQVAIADLANEYREITADDDDEMIKLKQSVARLNNIDKTIILLYAHHQSMRKVAKLLDVSLATAFNHIRRIQEKIKSEL